MNHVALPRGSGGRGHPRSAGFCRQQSAVSIRCPCLPPSHAGLEKSAQLWATQPLREAPAAVAAAPRHPVATRGQCSQRLASVLLCAQDLRPRKSLLPSGQLPPLVRGCACACPDAPCAPPPDGRCHGRLCPGSTRASSAGPLTCVLWASEKGEARVCRALPRRAHGRDPPAARARPSTPAEGAAQAAGGTGYCSSGPCPRCARGLAALRVGPRPCRRDAQPGLPSLPRWLFLCPSRHTGWCRVALGDRDSG